MSGFVHIGAACLRALDASRAARIAKLESGVVTDPKALACRRLERAGLMDNAAELDRASRILSELHKRDARDDVSAEG